MDLSLPRVTCMAEPNPGDRRKAGGSSRVHCGYRAKVITEDIVDHPLKMHRLTCLQDQNHALAAEPRLSCPSVVLILI